MWTDPARRRYERAGRRYATDLTDPAFALVEPLLPPPRSGWRSRTTSLREVLNAILYGLRTGCPAAATPKVARPMPTLVWRPIASPGWTI